MLSNITLITIDCTDNYFKARNALFRFPELNFYDRLIFTDKNLIAGKVKIPNISSGKEYSEFILHDLIKYIETEYVLIIQADGYIMNPSAWTNEFLDYDYIGAPWETHTGFRHIPVEQKVGNGGFSLRSKKYLEYTKYIFEKNQDLGIHPEDEFAIRKNYKELINYGIKLAPLKLARKFSIENQIYSGQFGFHGKLTMEMNKWN